MAFSEHLITSLADIPPLVHSFATTLGMNVAGTTGNPVVRHPTDPAALSFRLSTTSAGVVNELIWTSTTAVGAYTPGSRIRSPIFATDVAPTVGVASAPTKVFLIGMLSPEPYIAIVIEYGFNLYRHLYLGFMEKIGAYTGGEVVSSQNGPVVAVADANTSLLTKSVKNHMFSARQSLWSPAMGCGGVRVVHADNSVSWRNFYCDENYYGNIDTAIFDGTEALGGYGDSINDPLVARGINRLAGVDVLTPVNLYTVQPVTGAVRFRPIGRPSGVRLCNIQDIEPQAVNSIGAETWRIFAACSKRDSDLEPRAGTSTAVRYRKYESSYYLGIAYRSA